MKLLTAITIILSIPTMLASFWGMNVNVPFGNSAGMLGFGIILGAALLVCVFTIILLKKKDMF